MAVAIQKLMKCPICGKYIDLAKVEDYVELWGHTIFADGMTVRCPECGKIIGRVKIDLEGDRIE